MIPRKLNSGSGKKRLIDNVAIQKQLIPPVKENPVTFDPTGYYSDKTDLMEIHKFALRYLSTSGTVTETQIVQLDEIKCKLKSNMFMIERRHLEKQASLLETTIRTVASAAEAKVVEFTKRVESILKDWSERSDKGPIQLGAEMAFDPEKLYLIRAYLQITAEFHIPLNMSASQTKCKNGMLCPGCQNPFIEEEDQLICYYCVTYNDRMKTDVSFSDMGRVNNGNSNNYNEEETFDWAMTCFQGKQPLTVPGWVREKVDEYVAKKDIKKNILTPVDTIVIFKSIGYPEYENANLFLSDYNGWTLPDISQYEERLRQLNRQFMQGYEIVKVDRGSAPNAFWRLSVFLKKENIQVDTSGLKMPFLRTTKVDLDFNGRRTFQYLGWSDFQDTT